MTKYELLKSEADNAKIEWQSLPYGFERAVRFLHYAYLNNKLAKMPLSAAEKELAAAPYMAFPQRRRNI